MKRIIRTILNVSFILLITTGLHSQTIQNRIISSGIGHILPNTSFVEFNANMNSVPADIFKNHYKAFGLSDPSEMRLYRTDIDEFGLKHYRFRQEYKNVPIFGAEYIIHERRNASPTGYGFISPDFKIPTHPSISPQTALASALNEVNAQVYMWQNRENEAMLKKILKDDFATFYPEPQLMLIGPNVFPFMTGYKLAYKIDVYAEQPLGYYSVFVDAHSGAIITKYNNLQYEYETGTAVTLYHDTVQIVTEHFPGGFRLREVRDGVVIMTLDANNKTGLKDATDFTDTDNFWNNVNARLDETATDVHWSTEMTYDYYKQVHHRNSIDNKGMDIISLAHIGVNYANAYWNGAFMSYGDGNNRNPFTRVQIVGHELTHGVTQHTAALIYAYESGALNESFSDIFGMSIGYWAGSTNPDGSMIWKIISRDLADPNSTHQPDTYKGKYWKTGGADNGGVHTNSQVQNHWYYILCEGETGVNDNGQEYDVKPIGIEKAEKIAYRTLTYYLFPATQFSDARNASLQAAEELYGMCSDEYKTVANAWFAVGVGTPVFDSDIGISKFVAPLTSCEYLSDKEHIKINLQYYGCGTLISGKVIPVKVCVDKGDTLTENYTLDRNLKPGESVEYRTHASFDLSKAGKHTVSIWLEFPADSNKANDARNVTIYSGKGYTLPNDLGIVGIISPLTSCSELSDSEPVEIEIINNSCTAIPADTKFDLAYNLNGNEVRETVTLAKDLLSKEVMKYKFKETADLSTSGTYNMKITIDFPVDPRKGDNVMANQIYVGMISEFPYIEDFDDAPGGWTGKAIANKNDWQWGVPSQQFIDTAASGRRAWMTALNRNYSDASEMVLLSPCFDFSNLANPNVCFDAIFKFEKDFDGMILEYSVGDDNWQRVEVPGYNSNLAQTVDFGTPWFSGTNGGWKTYCTYLPQLGGESQVRFRFRVGTDANANDEGVAVDNFEVKPMNRFDLTVKSLNSPVSSCDLSDEEEISVILVSYGSDTLLSFDVSYSIDRGIWFIEKVEDTLRYNEPYIYTFKRKANLSMEGRKYKLNFDVSIDGDANPSNNAKSFDVEHFKQETMPLVEDFEEGNLPAGWAKSQTGNSKGWIFSDAETENARSGGKAWPIPEHTQFAVVNDISLNYQRRNDRLILPPLDLSNADNPALYFDVFYTDLLSSHATIEISTDGGGTWNVVDSCLPVAAKWRQKIVNLSDYKGESCLFMAFKFDDAGVKSTGMCIDNVELKELPEKDCAVTGICLPDGSFYSNKEKLIIKLHNAGTQPFDNSILTIIYKAGNKPPVKFNEGLGEIINPGETVLHQISQKLDFSDTVDYYVSVYQVLSGDKNRSNDTIANVKIETSPTVTKYPYKESFTKFGRGKPGKFINGWHNANCDEIDWWVNRGSTPTYYTGPSRDHTGSNGNYLYVESSYPFYNMQADLYSPVFDISQLRIPYLKFWYQMYSIYKPLGDVMGSLHVDVYDGTWHNDVWTAKGNQGSLWKFAEINLRDFNDKIKLRFRGLTGPAQYSDIALDDIEIYDKKKVIDIGISGLPKNGCGMTDGTDIPLKIKNNGTEHITGGIEIFWRLDRGTFNKEKYTGILKSGDEMTYYLRDIVLSKGAHYFDFIVNIPGDQVRSNDTVSNHRVDSYTDIFAYDSVTICQGLWAVVSSSHITGYDSYHWNKEGATGQVFYASEEGTYTVSYDFENGCTLTDSVYVYVLPSPSTGLQDMIIPEPRTIDAGEFESYLWQDGSKARTYHIDEDGEYFITVSDKNGCFGTDVFEVKIVVSVDDNESASLKAYPNPVGDYFELEIRNPAATGIKIELLNLKGVIVYSDKVSGSAVVNKRIDVSALPAGVYLLKIVSGDVVRIKKIVVQ
jgi:Zn-dependent metalloprotease